MLSMFAILNILTVFSVALWLYIKWSFSYWEKKGVKSVSNPAIPCGNISELITQKSSLFTFTKSTYEHFKATGAKYGGIYFFLKPIWIPVDLDLIRDVMIKDFSHFVNHATYLNEQADPLTANLFFLEDDKWKNTRSAMSHAFTAGKIKTMFQLMKKVADNFETILDNLENKGSIDIKDYSSRFTLDLIASIFFGLDSNSMENPDSSFRHYARRTVEDTGIEAIRTLAAALVPRKWLSLVGFKLIKPDVEEFFLSIVKDVVEHREVNNIKRKDFLQLLIELKNTGKVSNDTKTDDTEKQQPKLQLSINDMAAETLLFYVAGSETSATTTSFALIELCTNQEIQEKVREEIRRVLGKYQGELTYEACNEMEYLEQVIKETLRKYPPLATLTRRCTKDYRVPGSDLIIEKDTIVMIPVVGVHYDPDIYPEPEKFDPDRFGSDKKFSAKNAFLPFGEGPRVCIGMRLGLIQTKMALVTVLRNYKVSLNTKKSIYPVEFEPKYQVTTARGGVWIDLEKA